MRVINAGEIEKAAEELFLRAAWDIEPDVIGAIRRAYESETSGIARTALSHIIDNAELAAKTRRPICQDTGMAVVFIEIGNEVFIEGDINLAIDSGVKKAYDGGFLRASTLHPISRVKIEGNLPCVKHISIVPGENVRIIAAPKGFGSENMTRLFMLTPAQGRQGALEAIVRAVDEAGANPCPPIVVGVGIGGTAEWALLMSKRALLRRIGSASADPDTAGLEAEALSRVNALGIGAQGLGGAITALGVHIETYPTHIAGLPVAVSISCHALRHKEALI